MSVSEKKSWRGKYSPGQSSTPMVPLSALMQNPVEFELDDPTGSYSISVERGKNGKVWFTCQCSMSRLAGWCRHRLDVACFRYEGLQDASARKRHALEQIIRGTTLQAASQDTDRALGAFDECLRAFDQNRPADVAGRGLGKFTDLVSDLAACSGELEDAIGNLRRLLERD